MNDAENLAWRLRTHLSIKQQNEVFKGLRGPGAALLTEQLKAVATCVRDAEKVSEGPIYSDALVHLHYSTITTDYYILEAGFGLSISKLEDRSAKMVLGFRAQWNAKLR